MSEDLHKRLEALRYDIIYIVDLLDTKDPRELELLMNLNRVSGQIQNYFIKNTHKGSCDGTTKDIQKTTRVD